jgi:phosphotransferase system enzyme I (PtsI)
VKNGDVVVVDGFRGECRRVPDAAARALAARRRDARSGDAELAALRDLPAVTRDGRRIELGVNIELPGEVDQVLECGADASGCSAPSSSISTAPSCRARRSSSARTAR